MKCWEAGNTKFWLENVSKSSVEVGVQIRLRGIECEVNSFNCPWKDTICECATGSVWDCTCMEFLDWVKLLNEIEN